MKRRTLISAIFDMDTQDKVFDVPTVTVYQDVETELIYYRVRIGFIDLELYKEGIPYKKLRNLNSKQSVLDSITFALESVCPQYKGCKKVTDLYMSSRFHAIMYTLGVINLENE